MRLTLGFAFLLTACSAPEGTVSVDVAWTLEDEVAISHPLAHSTTEVSFALEDAPTSLQFSLPDGSLVDLPHMETSRSPRGWSAHGQTGDLDVTLTEQDGVLAGTIRTLTTTWALRTEAERLVLHELPAGVWPMEDDPVRYTPSLDDIAVPVQPAPGAEIVDVLFVYTPEALAGAGDFGALYAEVALAVEEGNAGLGRSGAEMQLRAVGLEPAGGNERGASLTDLVLQMQDPADGAFDGIHDLRDERGADLVMMVVEHEARTACGRSYVLNNQHPTIDQFAFGTVLRICAASNMSALHEVGHLLGSVHDRESSEVGEGLFDFSHGHVVEDTFKTVMAIGSEQRINRWSSPDHEVLKHATGVHAEADNAQSLTAMAPFVADFRDEVVAGATLTSPTGPALPADKVTFRWTDVGADKTLITIGSVLGGDDIASAVVEKGQEVTLGGLPHSGEAVFVRVWSQFGTHWETSDHAFLAVDRTPAVESDPAILVSPRPSSGVWMSGAPLGWTDVGASAYRVLVRSLDGHVLVDVETADTHLVVGDLGEEAVEVMVLTESAQGWYGDISEFVILSGRN